MSQIKIYNTDETMSILSNSNKSISRLGDGELKIILDSNYNIGFQKNDTQLQKRLKSILVDVPTDDVLVSVAFLEQPNSQFSEEKRNFLLELIKNKNSNYTFGSANITRISKYIPHFKNIWHNKNVIMVEGQYTRSGVGNDLFENVKSLKRIICPGVNAFKKYEDIYDYIINTIDKDDLILCSLGPTATVLSYDLSKLGYRVLDIGHLDIIHEWRKIGPEKYIIKGKYVNEVKGGSNIDDIGECDDQNYVSQVIKVIL